MTMRLLSVLLVLCCACQAPPGGVGRAQGGAVETTDTTAFSLDELQRRTFNYFWETALPGNYQIPDRWPTERFSSIAATGFGLTSYLVGVERGYVTREQAAERTLLTLEKLWSLPQGPEMTGVAGYRGLFYHFLTNDEALRYKDVELSTIDSGLLMAGVLSAQSYFDGTDETERRIRELADLLYRRVEWDWSLNEQGRMSMGWRPDREFIPADWNGYNEAMILLVLGLGSPTHPLPDDAWERWTENYAWEEFQGYDHLNFSPLFGHQYSHMYIDFRGIRDDYMREHDSDYFENSRKATLANRAYCIENPQGFAGYGPNQWGLTACDGPGGLDTLYRGQEVKFFDYRARGASARHVIDDGTIAPTAAGGSVPFAPEECIAALDHMWTTRYDSLVGPYGFRDAFNPSFTFGKGNENGWYDVDYLGIDQGPILIQIENHRSELIWKLMRKNPYIRRGLERAGFTGGWLGE
ncbi:glucoamylase family protein [Lewinella sp. JB7]|uniref:glucoamylase family protein n=1 Tax=Lewinella sp. JB7 TaxID=2962887 RepID=UPI0020CA00F4|nr:glucoamylase family protein [Lewinella sp. JB7]MCP9236995.1 Tat pathway signal protein [Lewinella sp. JB7]